MTIENYNSKQNLIIFVKSTPYGSENSFVALSNALVDFEDNLNLIIIFIFDGIWNLLKNHNTSALSNFPNIEDLYKSIITDADFYVYSKSLKRRNLEHEELLPGVKMIDSKMLFEIISIKGQNILFF